MQNHRICWHTITLLAHAPQLSGLVESAYKLCAFLPFLFLPLDDLVDNPTMAPRKIKRKTDHKPEQKSGKVTKSKRRTKKNPDHAYHWYPAVRRSADGLIDPTRKAGKYFKIARRNEQSSPLLQLPPEIRNLIYKFVLRRRNFEITDSLAYPPATPNIKVMNKERNYLSLLSVSRQIYAETRALPFSLNVFSGNTRVLKIWLSRLFPGYLRLIYSVRLHFRALMWDSIDLFGSHHAMCSTDLGRYTDSDLTFQLLPNLRNVALLARFICVEPPHQIICRHAGALIKDICEVRNGIALLNPSVKIIEPHISIPSQTMTTLGDFRSRVIFI